MLRILAVLLILFTLSLPAHASSNFDQLVAGAGPSTKVVTNFFSAFSTLPEAGGYMFTVPPKSAKHLGGINCSNHNLFGRTGRPLNTKERQLGKEEIFLAKVPIAFVVGEQAGVAALDLANLEKIFTGQIRNWKELGGADHEIILVGREPSEALFMELKQSYPFFADSKFDNVVKKDDHVINFIKSPQGQYGLAFGAKPNFADFRTLDVSGFNAGVRLGLVYDQKNSKEPLVAAARSYAASTEWQAKVVAQGLLPAN